MPRKFVYDKKTGEMVDTTPDREKSICDALGKDVERIRKALKPLRPRTGSRGYPYYSWNIGADSPEEEAAFRKKLRDHGMDAEFNGDGDLKIESEPHRQRVLTALDLYDRNGVKSPKNR
jgi:hypothetical protein